MEEQQKQLREQLEFCHERSHRADSFLEQAQAHLMKEGSNARIIVDKSALEKAQRSSTEHMLPSKLPNYTGKYLIERDN